MIKLFSPILFFFYFNYVKSSVIESYGNYTYVQTLSGGIKGYMKISENGRLFKVFEGIPYALPPIGDRRFEPTTPIPGWSGYIEALSQSEHCKQYDYKISQISGDEDCLYLNIYVPIIDKTSIPVIFWIHGGGFQYGTSTNYGPKYLMDRDVILVTINYRLGPFGFLSTNDDVVPGNMGLKDQNLALKWVNQNIQYFGGDPERITLTGVSAGGASVHYHYLSPLSRGLFRNGISFSGTAVGSFAHAENTRMITEALAGLVGCPKKHSKSMVRCLKRKTANEIYGAVEKMMEGIYFSFVLFPPVSEKVDENYFINRPPIKMIENGDIYDVPWITGIVKDDGLFMTAGFALKEDMVKHTEENWVTLAPYALHYKYTIPENEHNKLAYLSKKHYFGNKHFSTSREAVHNLTHLIGDALIVIGAERGARLQAKVNKSPVWFYKYTYRAAQSYTDYLTNSTINLGVCHDDDIYLVLENRYINPTTTLEDKLMLQDMLDLWFSFANNGKPNMFWKAFNPSASNFEYMNFGGPRNSRMEIDNNLGEINFWSSIGL